MVNFPFPKVYKELTSMQLPHNTLSWVKSLGLVGTGEKRSSKGGELLTEIETSGPGNPFSDKLYHLLNKNILRTARFSYVEPKALSMQRKDMQKGFGPNNSTEGLSPSRSQLYVAASNMVTYSIPVLRRRYHAKT